MKKLLSALCLLALFTSSQSIFAANAPDVGYFQRPDCTTLNPVAYSTVCLNTGSAGSLTQGNLYVYATASWVKLLQTETQTLDNVFDNGKTIDGATSFANAVRITDSSGDGVAIYRSSGNGPVVTCIISTVENDCDHFITLNASRTFGVKDDAGGVIWQTTEAGVTTLGWSYKPLKTIYWDAGSITTDGTNCGVPAEQALNSSESTWAFSCADSGSSKFSGKIRMPASWDGGTVTFTLSLFHGTSESITFAGDFSAQCRGAGEVISSTYGTAVAADVSITTAKQIAEATTAAVTPTGTCAASDWLLWRYVIDAANFSTNAANAKVIGVSMKYSVNALSD